VEQHLGVPFCVQYFSKTSWDKVFILTAVIVRQ